MITENMFQYNVSVLFCFTLIFCSVYEHSSLSRHASSLVPVRMFGVFFSEPTNNDMLGVAVNLPLHLNVIVL
jgi:hypothetical protein